MINTMAQSYFSVLKCQTNNWRHVYYLPNQKFLRSFPITIRGNGGHTVWLEESDVVNCGEYMVIRSRVKCDEKGNVVSANYSKILGSMGLVDRVGVEEAVFNPRPNDTNLEFDPKRNLYHGEKGRGKIP